MTTTRNENHAHSDVDAVDWDAGRRAFIRKIGRTAAGAAVFGAVGAGVAPAAKAQSANVDLDVLNFALQLEYLEAEFYLRAAFGRGLADGDVTGTGRAGAVRGGRKVNFATRNIRLYAEEIANDEEAHVKLLRSALGGARVARPQINLKESFTAAATAAKLIQPGQEFDPFANENNFLLASFIFEDVGVTAYKGAAPLLTDKAILETAAGLLGVEAYHAGIIRTLLFSKELYLEARAISEARDSLDGSSNLDKGIGNPAGSNLVPTDRNALAFSRSVPQVKSIVFLSAGASKGGFFPLGINGAFA
ncbi:ferritin-like domain-containing protein [Hansschlegelia sp. KR7-227]|uniref:ferritin-like domain-containing protein n=1 Tax=Hansschlegelia sp. KR7-227 TaxID=3400914 RepID=UPI003C1224F1